MLLAHTVTVLGSGNFAGWLAAIGMYIACLTVGSSTIWLGHESPLTLVVAAAGLGVVYLVTRRVKVIGAAPAE